jgi:hypothetical protein
MWLETIHKTNIMNILRTYGLINTDSKISSKVGLLDLIKKRFLIEITDTDLIIQNYLPHPMLLEQRKVSRLNVSLDKVQKQLTKYKAMLIQSQKQLENNNKMYASKIQKIKNYYRTMIIVGKFDTGARGDNTFPSSRQKFLINICKQFVKIFSRPEYYIKLCIDPSDVLAVTKNPVIQLLGWLLKKFGPSPKKTKYKMISLDLRN